MDTSTTSLAPVRQHELRADQPESNRSAASGNTSLLVAIFVLSTVAGGIHLSVTDHHFAEWWVYGVFFLAITVAQLLFAVLFLLPPMRPSLAVLGILGNLAVVGTYLLSRTIGVPIGWHAWTPEPVGVLDFTSTLTEVVLILCLLPFVPAKMRPWVVNILGACGIAAWALRLTGVLG